MARNKIALTAAGIVAAAGLVGGGTAVALAASPSSSSTTNTAQGQPGQSPQGMQGGNGQPGGGSQDTPVTGTQKDSIVAAVKAKDSAITITEVRMDPDGSFDVLGMSNGSPVFYEVSKDLKTITANTMGGPGGQAGPGGQTGPGGQAGQAGPGGQQDQQGQ